MSLAPLHAFNFAVEILVEDRGSALCRAAFAECDGMEVSMEVKTLRQGGDNGRQLRLTGPLAFGTLALKRGMTADFDLWRWFGSYTRTGEQRQRATVTVVVLAADGVTPRATFVLSRCVPVKLKAPTLNARDGIVAIEELQIAYESLELREATA